MARGEGVMGRNRKWQAVNACARLLVVSATLLITGAASARAQGSTDSVVGGDVLRRAIAETLVGADAAVADAPRDIFPATSLGQNQAQTTAPPAKPEHTGLAALVTETWGDFKAYPQRESTWVILGVGGVLAGAVHPLDNKVNRHLVGSSSADKFWKPGNYIGGVGMAVAPVAVYALGRYVFPPAANEPQTNKWSHLGFDLVRAQIVDEALVQGLKFSVRRTRPNGSKYSFPSGHASATFALASVLERHFGYRFAWPTVLLASYVATSRLHDNVHYLSDVVFGAALGTTVGWTVVGRHGRQNYALVPSIGPGTLMFNLTRVTHDQVGR
jgi:membrane-associated phospholipid phosphatase